jgi:diadenosine tetraphosphate (Ap4A) HIT family hydrolase
LVLRDGFPISRGHTLIVPNRHIECLFDLAGEEYQAIWDLVAEFRAVLAAEFKPDGFNVGVNEGYAAGQTIMHAHVHLIPRFSGDVKDPRGGVRWVIPHKAPYWEEE